MNQFFLDRLLAPERYYPLHQPSQPVDQQSPIKADPSNSHAGAEEGVVESLSPMSSTERPIKSGRLSARSVEVGDRSAKTSSPEIDDIDLTILPSVGSEFFRKPDVKKWAELNKKRSNMTRPTIQYDRSSSVAADRRTTLPSTWEAFNFAKSIAIALALLLSSIGVFCILFLLFALVLTWLWRLLFLSLLINAYRFDVFAFFRNIKLTRPLTGGPRSMLLTWLNVLLMKVRVYSAPDSWGQTTFRIERISIPERFRNLNFAHSLIYNNPDLARDIGNWIRTQR